MGNERLTTTITVQYEGKKSTYTIDSTNTVMRGISLCDSKGCIFNTQGEDKSQNLTYVAKNKTDYSRICVFLQKADANKDGVIDTRDLSLIELNRNDNLNVYDDDAGPSIYEDENADGASGLSLWF